MRRFALLIGGLALAASPFLMTGSPAGAAVAGAAHISAPADVCSDTLAVDGGLGPVLTNNGHNNGTTTTTTEGGYTEICVTEAPVDGYFQIQFQNTTLCATFDSSNDEITSEGCSSDASSTLWEHGTAGKLQNIEAINLGTGSAMKNNASSCTGTADVLAEGGGNVCQNDWALVPVG